MGERVRGERIRCILGGGRVRGEGEAARFPATAPFDGDLIGDVGPERESFVIPSRNQFGRARILDPGELGESDEYGGSSSVAISLNHASSASHPCDADLTGRACSPTAIFLI